MLVCDQITKRYGNQPTKAVDTLNLSIAPGQIFGFLGPNGAGKSTTIKMLTGLLRPDSGSISFMGYSLHSDPLSYKRLIGYVPDEPFFYERMSGYEHLSFIADLYGVGSVERKQRIDELGERLLLSHALEEEISSYSHGMKQKLSIISALLPSPRLLILDEPMVGLDPKATFILKTLLGEFAGSGNTVFFSTHVLEVAQQLCSSLGIIKEGRLLYTGTLQELQSRTQELDATLEALFLELTESEE
ncbi:MAG: Sulfate-transporting ATPase [Spirochaeta sp.]|jgi:ABC-2 type transport system ATP-binding protein|uniref:ABC transporter ATP-binding protein n=1 Tax=Sphaerochaeta sp. TaxID=1972642 RepID=UPI003D110B4D|nr:Sulfate-transporting ATPase [Spirochaeta sp.]